MINSYCRKCGLYITVPEQFAGGKGACPRCHVRLRIPKRPEEGVSGFREGMRLIAEPSDRVSSDAPAVVVSSSMGPSTKYTCAECGEKYESLDIGSIPPGQCPSCQRNNQPVVSAVSFPRPSDESPPPPETPESKSPDESGEPLRRPETKDPADTKAATDTKKTDESDLPLDGEFLVAKPAEDQSADGTIFYGVPIEGEGAAKDSEEPGSEVLSAEQSSPESIDESDKGGWMYLQKGAQHGPVSIEKLQELLDEHKINQSVLVWRTGMDGWAPLETIAEFETSPPKTTEPPPAPTGRAPAGRKRNPKTHKLSLLCTVTLWAGLGSLFVVILLAITRRAFLELRSSGFYLTVGLLAGVILAAILYSVLTLLKHRSTFSKLDRNLRLSAYAGLGLLGGCLAMTAVLAAVVEPPVSEFPAQRYIAQARQIHRVIAEGNLEHFEHLVALDDLNVNGDPFGRRYRQARSVPQQEEMTRELLGRLQPMLQRTAATQPAELPPLHWTVTDHDAEKIVLDLDDPTGQIDAVFHLRAGKLIAVHFPKDDGKPQPEASAP